MIEPRFCPVCGARLTHIADEERSRPYCGICGYVHYVNPVVAAGTLVEQDGKALLIRRGVEPHRGYWGLPAGYAEVGESPEEAAARETWEETGLVVQTKELLGVFGFRESAGPGGVLVLYAGDVMGGSLAPGSDSVDVAFFAPDELPSEIAFELHRRALLRWSRARLISVRMARDTEIPAARSLAFRCGVMRAADSAPDVFMVALDRGAVVGVATAHLEDKDVLVMDWLAVDEDYRRWGIASRLVAGLCAEGRARHCSVIHSEVSLDNPAVLLLTGMGFQGTDIRAGSSPGVVGLSLSLEHKV